MRNYLLTIGLIVLLSTAAFAEPNHIPIYTKTPVISSGTLTGNIASTRSDGVGTIATDLFKVFEANATNGSYVSKIRIYGAATTPTTMAASVIRIFISNKTSGATTATDTWLIQEISTAAVPAANASNAVNWYEVPLNIALPPSYTILVSIHANVTANTRWQCVAFGGDY